MADPPSHFGGKSVLPNDAILLIALFMQTASTGRITIEPGKRAGKPCIRGLRITVWDVLGWLGAGMTEEQILDEHPDLEKADFPAVYQFAAETGRRTNPA
jgi:uncharacterized protein (DUF433 family)